MIRKILGFFVMVFFCTISLHAQKEDSQTSFIENNKLRLDTSNVQLSPNPTKDKSFSIKLIDLKGESYVSIYNIIGVTVKKFKMTSSYVHVNLSEFSKGIYLVNVLNNRRKLVKKIVVK